MTFKRNWTKWVECLIQFPACRAAQAPCYDLCLHQASSKHSLWAVPAALPEPSLPPVMVQRSLCSISMHLPAIFPGPFTLESSFVLKKKKKKWDVLLHSGYRSAGVHNSQEGSIWSAKEKILSISSAQNKHQLTQRRVHFVGPHISRGFCLLESCKFPTLPAETWFLFLSRLSIPLK